MLDFIFLVFHFLHFKLPWVEMISRYLEIILLSLRGNSKATLGHSCSSLILYLVLRPTNKLSPFQFLSSLSFQIFRKISQPRALSSNIPAAGRGLDTKCDFTSASVCRREIWAVANLACHLHHWDANICV